MVAGATGAPNPCDPEAVVQLIASGLEVDHRFAISLDLAGDTDWLVRVRAGDVNGDGLTNPTGMSRVKSLDGGSGGCP